MLVNRLTAILRVSDNTWVAWCRYNSNKAHQHEVDDMMEAMEGTLYQHGVDVVFAGHVHAYESSYPVFRWGSHCMHVAATPRRHSYSLHRSCGRTCIQVKHFCFIAP